MSEEIREKGLEEKKASEPTLKKSHSDEPEVEGHMFVTGSTEKKSKKAGEVDSKRA